MKTLAEELEELRVRMHDLASNEQDLVTALGDALNHADNKLLDDLRNLSSEHEARRTAIVQELQRLASRLGALPKSNALLDALGPTPKLPPFEAASSQSLLSRSERREHGTTSIAEELSKHLSARAAAGH
jgi:hypothetical protein